MVSGIFVTFNHGGVSITSKLILTTYTSFSCAPSHIFCTLKYYIPPVKNSVNDFVLDKLGLKTRSSQSLITMSGSAP